MDWPFPAVFWDLQACPAQKAGDGPECQQRAHQLFGRLRNRSSFSRLLGLLPACSGHGGLIWILRKASAVRLTLVTVPTGKPLGKIASPPLVRTVSRRYRLIGHHSFQDYFS